MRKTFISSAALLLLSVSGQVALAAKKSTKKVEEPRVDPAPEMRVDPSLVEQYQSKAEIESRRVQQTNVQFIAVEPSIDFHQFTSFRARNEYFDVPLNGGSKSTMAPSLWVGHPTGAVWGKLVRARLGLSLSYLTFDGAQTVYQRNFGMEFRDNVSSQIFPVMASLRFTAADLDAGTAGVAPFMALSAGTMLTQVTGTLDGVSQSSWTPVTKLACGVRYSFAGANSLVGGMHAGVFSVSGSSRKAEWKGTGLTLGADFIL